MKTTYYLMIAGSLVGVFVVYKIMQKLGIVNSAQDDRDEEAVKEFKKSIPDVTKNYTVKKEELENWNSTFTSSNKIGEYCEILNGANNWYNDNEDAVIGVFSALKSKRDLESLNRAFLAGYKKDMISYLSSFLSVSDMARIYEIIKTKKK